MKTSLNAFAAACALYCCAMPLAQAANYTLTLLDKLSGAHSAATSINDSNQIVGYAETSDDTYHATLWSGGTITDLGAQLNQQGNQLTYATSINNAGQVAGYFANESNGAKSAIIWSGASITTLPSLGGLQTSANAINNSGLVAGSSQTPTYVTSATLWNGSSITALGTAGGGYGQAYAINDLGLAAGFSTTPGYQPHATLWNGTTTIDLGTLGGNQSYGWGINDAGQVVGASFTTNDASRHATLWDGTHMIDLSAGTLVFSEARDINNAGQIVGTVGSRATLWYGAAKTDLNTLLSQADIAAGWVLVEATSINEYGSIVGNAVNLSTHTQSAFLLTVSNVPEPASYGMLLAGLMLTAATIHRRKR